MTPEAYPCGTWFSVSLKRNGALRMHIVVTHSNRSSGRYIWYMRPEAYPCGTWFSVSHE